MQAIALTPDLFEGAVSIEQGDGYLRPWRLPFAERRLYPSLGENLLDRAGTCAGVRLRFRTDATRLRLTYLPLGVVNPVTGRSTFHFDATIDGDLVASAPAAESGEEALVDGLPDGSKIVELWFPQDSGVALRSLEIDAGRTLEVVPDPRPTWITYGSSITHSVRGHSPARIWPSIVARRHQLNLTCLGFGGQCHLETMLGRLIRDLPADFISLKLGINTYGSNSLNRRTYMAAAIGLVKLIRERHPRTPLALISPIAYPPGESNPSAAGITIQEMREDLADAAVRLAQCGDDRFFYVDGLNVFSLDELAEHSTDQCHPGPDGIEIMADNFDRVVMTRLLAMA